MNHSEATTLIANLNRAGMTQALEGQAAIWADALDDVTYPDAWNASRALMKTTARWVTPGDIRAAVKDIRRRRTQDMATPIPPECIAPDDTATERAWTHAYVNAIGNGLAPAAADYHACQAVNVTRPEIEAVPRPVPALIAQVAATTHIPPRDAA